MKSICCYRFTIKLPDGLINVTFMGLMGSVEAISGDIMNMYTDISKISTGVAVCQ